MPVTYDLKGSRVLIVGASSGLGREIGWQAAAAGARVAFAARRLERCEEAAAQAQTDCIGVRCDVRDEASCAATVEGAVARLGGLDAFVYSTGMSPLAMVADADLTQWQTAMETNVVGAALIARAALPHLRASGGRGVFLSSYAVRRCMPGLALYRVSKLALDGLIQCLRDENRDVDFTRVVVGNTVGSEFGTGWDPEKALAITSRWVEERIFPVDANMPIEHLAEAVLSVLAVRGYVDDIAVMPRQGDVPMGEAAEQNADMVSG